MNHDDRYIGFTEAAELMGCTRIWIQYLRRGEGKAMGEREVDGRLRLHRDTFLAWMDTYNRTRKRVQKVKTARE